MKRTTRRSLAVVMTVIVTITLLALPLAAWLSSADASSGEPAAVSEKPALTVSVTTLEPATLALRVSANGNIQPWQEAIIGTEADGLRLTEVMVNVGDLVTRGQVLATFASDTLNAELAQSHAATAEAEATLAEAEANAQRAKDLQTSGALSAQQINQYVTAQNTARARLEAARATERMQRLRLAQTKVLAPDDGVVSARSATVGAVLPAGQELFRLIRGRRLEWRAEVAAADLDRLQPGQLAQVRLVNGQVLEGRLRIIAPVVDTQSRNGLVYVDLPTDSPARAGMFAQGEFTVGMDQTMTLPQSAVLLRDGFSYVLHVGPDSKVRQTRVTTGRRMNDRVEIISGVDSESPVVLAGGGFLVDGDLVRVVAAPALDQAPIASGSGAAAAPMQPRGDSK